MLVLTRLRNQAIIIRTPLGDIRVSLQDIRGPKARLGVEAPVEIEVDREEIRWRKDKCRRNPPEGPGR